MLPAEGERPRQRATIQTGSGFEIAEIKVAYGDERRPT